MLNQRILLVTLIAVASGCGQSSFTGESSKMHDVLGALQIRNPNERDAALAEACRAAAAQGEGPAVLIGVPKIENKELRDSVADECSDALYENGAATEAHTTAELISDETKRNNAITHLGG